MNRSFRKTCRVSATITLLLALSGTLHAGGLVDTSLDRFLAETFSDAPPASTSAVITNPWWTLPAGSNFLYFAESEGKCAWNLVQVLTSTTSAFGGDYAGTLARIILDREWVDEGCEYDNFAAVLANVGPPAEQTYDWYAQDDDGNIWYLGEDTRDDEGSSAGSFVAGCDGAEAGIVILGDPHNGDFYQQEYYAGEAEDWGKVTSFLNVDDHVCLRAKEWTPLSPGHIEFKFYCSDGEEGVLMMVHELKGKTVHVELVDTNVAGAPANPVGNPSPTPAACPP